MCRDMLAKRANRGIAVLVRRLERLFQPFDQIDVPMHREKQLAFGQLDSPMVRFVQMIYERSLGWASDGLRGWSGHGAQHWPFKHTRILMQSRSEERRVGKECMS